MNGEHLPISLPSALLPLLPEKEVTVLRCYRTRALPVYKTFPRGYHKINLEHRNSTRKSSFQKLRFLLFSASCAGIAQRQSLTDEIHVEQVPGVSNIHRGGTPLQSRVTI